MGKNKLLAGLSAGVLVTSAMAASLPSSSAAPSGGSDAVFTPSNPNLITINDTTTVSGTATPQNAAGVITDVNLTLFDLGHTHIDDIDLELVSPTGVAVPMMSDMCGSTDTEDIDLTFDDEAGAALPDSTACTSGTYKPGNIGTGDTWPVNPGANTALSAFDGINPNGGWTVQLVDDVAADVGDIEGGFSLTIVTAPFSILIPGTGSIGAASPYPAVINVTGKVGAVADVNVVLPNVTQQYMEDLDILLVAPNGTTKAMVMSDACVGAFVTENDYVLDDEAAAAMPAGAACPSGTYKPTDAAIAPGAIADPLPAPAPGGPYASALSTFDGINPNGNWSLYIVDDQSGGNGFFSSDPSLVITMTDTTAPDTKLVGKKPENTTKTKVKIKFTSTEAGSTFKCKVDSKKYKPCTSPLKLKNLKLGKHKVLIVATDAAGNKDPKALKIKWKIFPKN